jgi:signal transduction histidine kinase
MVYGRCHEFGLLGTAVHVPRDRPLSGELKSLETPSSPWRRLGRLALAAATMQLVFWLGVRPLLFSSPTLPPLYEVSDAREATLTDPGTIAVEQAQFTPTTLPWTSCCGPGYRALRFTVNIPQVPEHGIALIPNVDADNLQVRINGQLVDARGRMKLPRPTFEANVKRVIHVAPAVFHAGANQVEYVMVRQVLPYFDVSRPIFADFAVAWPRFKFREFMLTNFELMGVALGAVICLFAIVLLLRSSQRGMWAWLLVLASSWSLLAHFYFWLDPPFSAQLRMVYYFALTNLLPVAWLNFSDQWTRRPLRWLAPASMCAYALWMAATLWTLNGMQSPTGFDSASSIANWFGLAFSAAAILRFLLHVVGSSEERFMEFAVFALCITLLASDLVSELLWQNTSGYVIRSVPLLLLAFLAAFLARNVRLFQSTHEINQLLRVRLEAREAELAETHRRESDLVRREAHQAERQRLMRDMHDGVGSQLTSMLFAARRGALPAENLADALQTIIDEIRLLIDSMDSVSDSFTGALEAFQHRAEARLAAAGVKLEYHRAPGDVLPAYAPREVLQVMRILQEAFSNALRHAGCSQVLLQVSATGDDRHPVQVLVRDNGGGFTQNAQPGRGLANMKSRAEAMGALLTIEDTVCGVTMLLMLPSASSGEPA